MELVRIFWDLLTQPGPAWVDEMFSAFLIASIAFLSLVFIPRLSFAFGLELFRVWKAARDRNQDRPGRFPEC